MDRINKDWMVNRDKTEKFFYFGEKNKKISWV